MQSTTLFKTILYDMGETHEKKNARYGNAYYKTREKYPEIIAGILNFKLGRLETLLSNPSLENEESIEDTLLDMANYCVMELTARRMEAWQNRNASTTGQAN